MENRLRIVGTDHVNLLIPPGGEDEARRFYGGVLGLREIPKPEPLASRGGCWFEAPGIDLHLSVEEPFAPERKGHPGLWVASIEMAAQALEAAGLPVERDDSVAGVHRIYTTDPFGNRIELLQDGEAFRQRAGR